MPQVSASRRCPLSATPRQLIKVGPAKGLDRKQIAPAFTARARLISSGKAVMKMNGARLPSARIIVKRSNPLIPGICRSAITQEVSSKRPECRNCSADEYVSTVYPCDLRNLLVAARTDESSSTTEITESSDKPHLPDAGASPSSIFLRKYSANQHFKIIPRFVRSASGQRSCELALTAASCAAHRPSPRWEYHSVAPELNLGKAQMVIRCRRGPTRLSSRAGLRSGGVS
jgi:hypothetical protein